MSCGNLNVLPLELLNFSSNLATWISFIILYIIRDTTVSYIIVMTFRMVSINFISAISDDIIRLF